MQVEENGVPAIQPGNRDALAENMGDLSILTPQKNNYTTEQAVFQEVRLCTLPKTANAVYRCERLEGAPVFPGSQTYHRQWAQVFDVAEGTSVVA